MSGESMTDDAAAARGAAAEERAGERAEGTDTLTRTGGDGSTEPANGSASGGAAGREGGTGPGGEDGAAAAEDQDRDNTRPPARSVWLSVAPYLIIIVVFSLAQIPPIKAWLTQVGGVTFHWPGLDVVNSSGDPVGAQNLRFDHLKATGTLLLISGILTMLLYRIAPAKGVRIYGETLKTLRWTIVTVCSVLALSFVMNLSGQTTTLGVALASAGGFFALLSPLLGWIGVALTGSDTSSNSLFGQLQVAAAEETGLSPTLMAAANSSAGVLGKMLSLQNLAIAAAAVGLNGVEGTLLRKLIGWSLGLLVLMTLLIWLQSTPVLGWMVP